MDGNIQINITILLFICFVLRRKNVILVSTIDGSAAVPEIGTKSKGK